RGAPGPEATGGGGPGGREGAAGRFGRGGAERLEAEARSGDRARAGRRRAARQGGGQAAGRAPGPRRGPGCVLGSTRRRGPSRWPLPRGRGRRAARAGEGTEG